MHPLRGKGVEKPLDARIRQHAFHLPAEHHRVGERPVCGKAEQLTIWPTSPEAEGKPLGERVAVVVRLGRWHAVKKQWRGEHRRSHLLHRGRVVAAGGIEFGEGVGGVAVENLVAE